MGLQLHDRRLHRSERSVLCGSGFHSRPQLAPGSALQLREPAHGIIVGGLQLRCRQNAGAGRYANDRRRFRTDGIALGCEASLTYKQVELSISNEYVFDTTHKSGNFYYSWPQLTYSPTNWFRVGLVAQHIKAFHTSLDVQRGFLVGVSHKKLEFTTYIFNAGFTDPTVVLEVGVNF